MQHQKPDSLNRDQSHEQLESDRDPRWSTLKDLPFSFDQTKSLARQQAENCALKMHDIQDDFHQQIEDYEKEHLNDSDSTLYVVEHRLDFEKAEDDLKTAYFLAQEGMKIAELDPEEQTQILEKMVVYKDLNHSIEAQAGHFFRERSKKLREMIKHSGDKDAQEKIDYIADFINKVNKHCRYKYLTHKDFEAEFAQNPELFEHSRTEAHNDVIKHINGMNALAEEYHVRPFTARNFRTFSLDESDKLSPADEVIRSYDRNIVEQYYNNVFPDAEAQAKRRQEMQARYFY